MSKIVPPRGLREELYNTKKSGIYLGIVKKNFDGQRMGRLMVWISDFGPDDPENWYPVSYASPFAGSTPVEENVEGGLTEDDSQKSYGFWATPPDIGNQVLVCFLNGDISDGFWFACIYPQNMNHMVPGIGSSKGSTDPTMDEKFPLYGPPTVEYNKKDKEIINPTSVGENAETVRRPVFGPLAKGLIEQGLTNDPERGISNSSARRESPSRVFGLLSPRGNSFHIDDGPIIPATGPGSEMQENEFIRFRTRSGAQILIHETSGYIYMITKGGNSWVEISDGGIDLYSSGPISMSSDADVNIHSGGKVGIHGEQGVHIKGGAITAYSEGNFDVAVKGSFTMETIGSTNFLSNLDFNIQTSGDISENAGKNIIAGACGIMSRNARFLLDNAGGPSPNDVEHPEVLEEVVSRTPEHEPYGHLISANSGAATGVDANGNPTTEVIGSDGSVSQVPIPVNANKAEIMMYLYKAYRSLGFTVEGARSMVAQIGRENDFNPGPMFGTHTDYSNGLANVGIISWQGSRRTALLAHLRKKGCIGADGKIKAGYATLGAQAEFSDIEMRSQYKKSARSVRDSSQNYGRSIEDTLSRNYVGWAKGGNKNGKFTKSDSNRALAKMNAYYATIKKATEADG